MRRRCVLAMIGSLSVGLPSLVQAQIPESTTQMTLASSQTFQTRVQYLLLQQARLVLTEAGVGATHVCRAAFARQVVDNVDLRAQRAAPMLAGGANLIGTVVMNPDPNLTDSSATDAAIFSQIATFWNPLAGCDIGS